MKSFSVRTFVVFVFLCACAFVALRSVNHRSAWMMPLVALASVWVAMVEAAILRGKSRYWCIGFALFCGVYLSLAFAPRISGRFQPIPGTSYVLTELFDRFSPLTTGGAKMEQINRTSHARPAQLADFRRVGHSLFALLAGLLGGTFAVWFYGKRQEHNP
jgi:hypothetical protein